MKEREAMKERKFRDDQDNDDGGDNDDDDDDDVDEEEGKWEPATEDLAKPSVFFTSENECEGTDSDEQEDEEEKEAKEDVQDAAYDRKVTEIEEDRKIAEELREKALYPIVYNGLQVS